MKVTRRDLLVWGAGATAGLALTPVPWKLLDDTSIWSQNWSWIPQPGRGPVEVKQSACTLCPKGCGMQVRTADGWPVGVSGVSSHPTTHGALCPLAFGAHQLNWHPLRLRNVRHRGTNSSWEEAKAAFVRAYSEGPVLIIDGYPGRSASQILEASAKKQIGSYRVVLGPESQSLVPYETWSGVPVNALGYDFENAKTVVSFGAPLLDGWGTPGQFTRLWADRAAGTTNPDLRVIQVEASLSRTAARAWKWIPIRPDSEAVLAAGVARVLLEEHLVAVQGPMPSQSLSEVAGKTGLTTEAIRDLAHTIVSATPAVVVARDDNPSIAALNVLLGAVGARGGIVRTSKTAKPYLRADAPVAAVRAVLLDSSVPWDFDPPTDAEIFRFAAWDGGPTKADWLLPAPGFLEEMTDIPTAPASPVQTYALAPELSKPPAGIQSAAQFLASIDASLPSIEKLIDTHCEEIFHHRSGALYGKQAAAISSLATAQSLKDQLLSGAVWAAQPARPEPIRCNLDQWPATPGAPPSVSSSWRAPVLPPLASKLYQESNLRESAERRNA